LVTDGTFRVIERKALDAVLAEQNFSNSDRANPNSASKLGKVLGVNAMVVGSITQFGTEKKKFGIGGIGGKLGGFGGGKIGTQKGKAVVAIDARVVDVNTGEILAVARGKGESARKGLLLKGGGGGGGGFGAGGIEMGSSDFRESILGEATTAAVQAVAAKLIGADDKMPEIKFEIRGLVADVAGSTVILNVGSSHGLQVGDTLNVLRVSRTIKDPATGKVLREVTKTLGQVKISEADEGSSVGIITSGSGIKVGDLVRN
jgi:curli biogenesis system outer membrane secretion channel CsgG